MASAERSRQGASEQETWIGMWFVGWNEVVAISNPPRGFDEPQLHVGSRLTPPRK